MNKLYLVGLGPGERSAMTDAAFAAMENSDVICGYPVYVELIRNYFPDKEFYTTPMRRELERCMWAIDTAESGKTVAMVCSGDAGVYGMAGPVLELAEERNVEIEVVPGITAALSGAAVLGAPLMHDFCVISLSDLLTPWERIEKRLRCAAQGDFSIAIYNPCSNKRPEHLSHACDILLETLLPDTVCGWVRNIGREGESYGILSLAELKNAELDMFTTVFIGNSTTKIIGGKMVTPRGYEVKK